MDVVRTDFQSRAERSAYVAKRYADRLATAGHVLDVGCDERALQGHLPEGVDYTGIDIGGDPTFVVDLERIDRLPFDDDAFGFTVCTEVLEHIDTLHHIFDEMVRVTRGPLLVSLPNCWRAMKKRWFRGRGTPRFYGLPVDRPEDRHKWFFNVDDVVAFFDTHAERRGLRVVDRFVIDKPRNPLDRAARVAVSRGVRPYLNKHAISVWTLLER